MTNMISFIKAVFSLLAVFLCTVKIAAQEVKCYQLIESSDLNIKNGCIQFISFIGDQCYESDSKGTSVKNGTMQKNGYQSSRESIVYSGTCFCGSGAKFEFNHDKAFLTVSSNNKIIYKFKEVAKPQGVYTSSLIRKYNKKEIGGNSNYYSGYGLAPDNGYNENNYSKPKTNSIYNNSNTNTKSISNNNSNTQIHTQRKCAYCNGGEITKNDNAAANFGIDKPKKRCTTCGIWFDPNTFNHYHIKCRHCGGSGYLR